MGQMLLTGAGGAANVLASVPWVAQWKFNNNGNDSVGANNLTNNNSATFTAGLLGGATGATQLVAASSQYWSIASNAILQMGAVDFTICGWVNFSTIANTRGLVTKHNATPEYHLAYNAAASRFQLKIRNAFTLSANNFGAASTGAWICVMAWYDKTNNLASISINNGTANTTAYTHDGTTGTDAVNIGNNLGFYLDALMDNWGIAKSAAGGGGVLSAAQRTAFFNAGVGTETLS